MSLVKVGDVEKPFCNSRTEFGDINNGYCGVQSFFIIAGGLGAAFWFLVVGANLFLMLVFDYK